MQYVWYVAVTWAASADKHRIPHEDAIRAIANAYYVEIEFDEPRLEGKVRPTLYVGPPRQLGGHLLEVMVEPIPPRGMHIVHVMHARQEHLDRMEKDSR